MKIVVTGALGHIGSRLIRDLPLAFPDAEIVLIDNLSTQRYCSLFNLPQECKYAFVETDILNADLASLFVGVQAVIHLAAITDAASSFEKKDVVEQVNVRGTERVARACIQAGCPLFFPSTTSVYGTQKVLVDEDCAASDLQPQSPYAESKLRAEEMLQRMGREQGLRFVICRFGTIFGPSSGMRFHTAVNKFVWQACVGQPLTVWRTALHQNRPYLDLRDATKAIAFIMRNALFDGRIYNVLTLNATVDHIVAAIRASVPELTVQFVESPIMNQLSYEVSNRRFVGSGFEFVGDLERGIRESIGWLNSLKQGIQCK